MDKWIKSQHKIKLAVAWLKQKLLTMFTVIAKQI